MNRMNLYNMILVAMFAALTAVGAWISFPVPFSPVPVAFANLFTLLAGVILGKWLGALSQVVYIAMGVIGIPVFAGFTAGPGVLAGPTGGYLVGYIAAAFIAGALVEYLPRRLPDIVRISVGLVTGGLTIYLFGLPWLAFNQDLNLAGAFTYGFVPYWPGDVLKVVVAAILSISLLQQVPEIRRFTAGRLAESNEVG